MLLKDLNMNPHFIEIRLELNFSYSKIEFLSAEKTA